ncbi:hypothetical protein P7C73_g203, partial [Tremellales sp. Uapishka_1]
MSQYIRRALGSVASATTSKRILPQAAPLRRAIQTTTRRSAKYERFDTPSYGTPSGPSPPGGGRPDFMSYLRRRLGGDRAVWVYGIGLTGGGLYYVTHLERVPETGRLRFMDVNESQEQELGLQTQRETLTQYSRALLPASHPTTKRVRAIATRIVEGSGLGRMKAGGAMGAVESAVPAWGGGGSVEDVLFGGESGEAHPKEGKDTEWEVYVIDDKTTKNAFVLPGGKIFVFTGILPVSANDDGLATVLGHEVAHQVARHSAERMSSMKVLFVLGFLLESLGLDVGISRLLLTFMLQLPNSRKNESEADFIGLQLMSRACFDPTESSKMWKRMSDSEGSGGSSKLGAVDFLSTHPANAKRIKQLEKWMPEALQIRAASPCAATASSYGGFLDALAPSGGFGGAGAASWSTMTERNSSASRRDEQRSSLAPSSFHGGARQRGAGGEADRSSRRRRRGAGAAFPKRKLSSGNQNKETPRARPLTMSLSNLKLRFNRLECISVILLSLSIYYLLAPIPFSLPSFLTMQAQGPQSPPVAAMEDGGPVFSPGVLEKEHAYHYEVVQGFFLQNGPEPKHKSAAEMLDHGFGLIDTTVDRWRNLKRGIQKLQDEAPTDVQYKVLFLGPSSVVSKNVLIGQWADISLSPQQEDTGKGGTILERASTALWCVHGSWQRGARAELMAHLRIQEWEAKWAMMYTDGEIVWGPDPELTPLGVSQAQAVQSTWKKEGPLGAPITKAEMRWFVSPLTRTGQTMQNSWGEMLAGVPQVWEDFREVYGSHTCDQRSSKTYIEKRFPSFEIEEGFAENDELWKADERETDQHMQFRSRRAMDRLFGPEGAEETYISITGHSAIFGQLLVVLGHQPYPLETGEMIPVAVKATKRS